MVGVEQTQDQVSCFSAYVVCPCFLGGLRPIQEVSEKEQIMKGLYQGSPYLLELSYTFGLECQQKEDAEKAARP